LHNQSNDLSKILYIIVRHTGCGELNQGTGCGYAGHAAQEALLQTLAMALSKSVWTDKGGKS
jgi:hypothetical protein